MRNKKYKEERMTTRNVDRTLTNQVKTEGNYTLDEIEKLAKDRDTRQDTLQAPCDV